MPELIKIVVLDIDGVIAIPDEEAEEWRLNKECQDNLEYIIKHTDAKIVISSSWRKHTLEETITLMREKGFRFHDRIIGITIRAYHYIDKTQKIHLSIPRGVEIKQWIDTHIHSDNGVNFSRKKIGQDYIYVILDDDSDMLLEQKDYFIQTKSFQGLTHTHADKAVEILNKESR